MKKLLIILLFTKILFAQAIYFPSVSGNSWETLSPSVLNWKADQLDTLYNYLAEKNTKAFIILKDGKITVEWYFDQFTQDSIWYWASAGKTITALLIGIAQDNGYLDINDKTSDYLGIGWSSCPREKEDLITIRHQLTMTTGLDFTVDDIYDTNPGSLLYRKDAGTQWYYHNAPYTLLRNVIEAASGQTENRFTRERLADPIGMKGLWLMSGFNNVYFSNARSMARFGLLIHNRGIWDGDTLLYDQDYFESMINSSQKLNPSYGYLWWLNGKGQYMLPATQLLFNSDLIPNAPNDLIAALGKNDQKVYVSDSLGLVVIRMGNDAGQTMFALSSFDNELWGKILDLYSYPISIQPKEYYPSSYKLYQNYPNPFNPNTTIVFNLPVRAEIRLNVYDILGRHIEQLVDGIVEPGFHRMKFDGSGLPSGIYVYKFEYGDHVRYKKMVLMK